MDSHLAPFHINSYTFTFETYFSQIMSFTSVYLSPQYKILYSVLTLGLQSVKPYTFTVVTGYSYFLITVSISFLS